jgi:hypothetical protein
VTAGVPRDAIKGIPLHSSGKIMVILFYIKSLAYSRTHRSFGTKSLGLLSTMFEHGVLTGA